jgi:iron(III) transport system ATP-binding protein
MVAFASSLDQAGPMTRSVRDSAIMLQAMVGHDPKDSTMANEPIPDFEAALQSNIKGLKVGIPKEYRIDGMSKETETLWHMGIDWLKAAGATALFVTHDQLEAFAIGDRIGVMHEGRLQQWDEAYALDHRPATRFVAEFIGPGVFAHAQISLRESHVVVSTALGDLKDMEECPLPGAYADGLCDVLLRADDIVHDDASPVKAQILRKSFRGSEFLYTLRLQSGETVMAHVPSHHDHALDEWIGIRAEVEHVVTFPRVLS